jgi:hypothetical protein
MTVKSMSGDCFSVLVFLNLSLWTCLILPYILRLDVVSFSISMSLLFFCFSVFNKKNKNKMGEKMQIFFFFFSFDSFSDIVCVLA